TKTIETRAEEISTFLKAISNKNRLIILCALCKGEKCVGELELVSDLSQSALSQHLAKLRHEGLVETRREAQTIYYSTNHPAVKIFMKAMCDYYA
ncbi:MAG: ArsR/SmtB family transcription factor, partial [Bdellovibrionales bacterium]